MAAQLMGAKPTARPVERPWVEKYRPRTMDDISSQTEVVEVLKRCVQGADMPHLLLYGPPGTGKTSTILALARELYGPELMRERVKELNASDERGIDVVREKVKSFAQVTATAAPTKGYPCPAFKIIILDEADAMTKDAQTALRRTMEQYSKTTRFCLICNYISRIIEPLASRCAKFRFKPLAMPATIERLSSIAAAEGVIVPIEVLETLVPLCSGDLRQAITCLQSGHRLSPGGLTLATVHDILGVVPRERIQALLIACSADNYQALETSVRDLMADGYAAGQICMQLHDLVLSAALSDWQKARVAEKLAKADANLGDGADEELQLLALCGSIMATLRTPNP